MKTELEKAIEYFEITKNVCQEQKNESERTDLSLSSNAKSFLSGEIWAFDIVLEILKDIGK